MMALRFLPTSADMMLILCSHYCCLRVAFIFREMGREGERDGEKHQCARDTLCPQLRTWPATQACALTGNRTSGLQVFRVVLNPLSHTSQGIRTLTIGYNSTLHWNCFIEKNIQFCVDFSITA